MAASSLKLLFDEMFSHKQVGFVSSESRLCPMQHIRTIGWSGQPDSVWIPLAVKSGFTIVSGDRNDRTRLYTVADLKQMKAKVIILEQFFDHMKGWDKAKWLVNNIEKLVAFSESLMPGSVSALDRNGSAKEL